MTKFKLNIYDENDEKIVRTVEATDFNLGFGIVRKLMKLVKVDDKTTEIEMLSRVSDAWEDLTKILGRVFPDITEEEWDHVLVPELLVVVVKIAKYSLSHALTIPTEKN